MTTTAELADRVFDGILGTYDTWAIYVGDKLGFYRGMRDGAPLVAEELAQKTGVNARYVREWLEQQAVTGFVTCDNPAAPANGRSTGSTPPEPRCSPMTSASNFLPRSCA